MMRGQRYVAVAVRAPSQEIIVRSEELPARLYQSWFSRVPLLRGTLMLWDTLILGMRALMFSADVLVGEEDAKLSRPVAWSTVALGLLAGVGLFFLLPLALTGLVHHQFGNSLAANLLEGLVRVALIMVYVGVIGFIPDIRQVYRYHGAEHKAINAFEDGAVLDPARVIPYSIRHPRCGTNFLLIVAVLAVAVMAPLGRELPWPVLVGSRVLLIPVVAGLAYEAIRWGAARITNPLVAALMQPGMAMQALTTREPDAPQVEVATRALTEVIRLERPDLLGIVASAAPVGPESR